MEPRCGIRSRATIHWFLGNAGAMLYDSERAFELARRIGNLRIMAAAGSYIAAALLLGEAPLAHTLPRQQALIESLSDRRVAQSAASQNLGLLLAMMGRTEESRAHVEASREVFNDLGQRRWLADAFAKSGLVSRLEGRLPDAERDLRESYRFFREQHDAANTPEAACELGRVLHELGRDDEAERSPPKPPRRVVRTWSREWAGGAYARRCSPGVLSWTKRPRPRSLELVSSTDFLNLHAEVLFDLAGCSEPRAAKSRPRPQPPRPSRGSSARGTSSLRGRHGRSSSGPKARALASRRPGTAPRRPREVGPSATHATPIRGDFLPPAVVLTAGARGMGSRVSALGAPVHAAPPGSSPARRRQW